jgi:osmotically-inducible protein OsmY
MSLFIRMFRVTFVLLVAGVISGCSMYAGYQKCGFAGFAGDAAITAAVLRSFQAHPVLEPPNLIDIQTVDRIVYLNGLVDTDTERELAESVARNTEGVARVVNSIGLSSNR